MQCPRGKKKKKVKKRKTLHQKKEKSDFECISGIVSIAGTALTSGKHFNLLSHGNNTKQLEQRGGPEVCRHPDGCWVQGGLR